MRTLGVDLAAAPKDTATCTIDWSARRVEVVTLGVEDDAIVAAVTCVDRTAIDAPFGWPDAFLSAVSDWSGRGVWTGGADRRPLRLRQTDMDSERLGGTPLSVSADRIASVAFRCALLLDRCRGDEPLDRVGGRVVEVYPAAALRRWVGAAAIKGYKSPEATAVRARILEVLRDGAALDLADHAEKLIATDHALDALVSALVARAVANRHTDPPSELTERIRREGWIHVPTRDLQVALR